MLTPSPINQAAYQLPNLTLQFKCSLLVVNKKFWPLHSFGVSLDLPPAPPLPPNDLSIPYLLPEPSTPPHPPPQQTLHTPPPPPHFPRTPAARPAGVTRRPSRTGAVASSPRPRRSCRRPPRSAPPGWRSPPRGTAAPPSSPAPSSASAG